MPRIEGRRPFGTDPHENPAHREADQRAEPSQRRTSHSAFSLGKGRAPIKELGDFADPRADQRLRSAPPPAGTHRTQTSKAQTMHSSLVSAAVSEWSRSWSRKLKVAGSSPTPVTFCADGRDFALRALPHGTASARSLPTQDASQ